MSMFSDTYRECFFFCDTFLLFKEEKYPSYEGFAKSTHSAIYSRVSTMSLIKDRSMITYIKKNPAYLQRTHLLSDYKARRLKRLLSDRGLRRTK